MKITWNLTISALMMLFATSAYSATYNLGVLGSDPVFQNVSVGAGTGAFNDSFKFVIAADSTGASSVSNHALTFFGTDILDISGLELQIYSTTALLVGSYENLSLAAGEYHAEVYGKATGVSGGNYTFSVIAAPVPEASTLSLMMAGFGLVGFMSYRRRNII